MSSRAGAPYNPGLVTYVGASTPNGNEQLCAYNNALCTLTRSFMSGVTSGLVPGSSVVRIIGWNPDVDDSALDDMCELGVNVIPLPTDNVAMEVVSDDANDDDGGTGVNTVHIGGLVNSGGIWSVQAETVTMNGTTPVATANSYVRINIIHAGTVGSGGVAAGTISLQTLTTGAVEYARIEVGGNRMLQAQYTVPSGKRARLISWGVGFGSQATKDIQRAVLRATVDPEDATLLSGTYLFQDIMVGESGANQHLMNEQVLFPAKCDIKISAQQMNGTGLCQASGTIVLLQENE